MNVGDAHPDNACVSASLDDAGAGGCVAFPLKLHKDDGVGDVHHQRRVCVRAHVQENHACVRVHAVL